MSNLGKCERCNRTCYSIEGWTVGPPNAKQVYHKSCFKCQNDGCEWQLNLTNYKFYEGHVYCKNHCPVTGFSNKKDGVDYKVHGTTTSHAIYIEKPLNAPKLDTVNEQIRGTRNNN